MEQGRQITPTPTHAHTSHVQWAVYAIWSVALQVSARAGQAVLKVEWSGAEAGAGAAVKLMPARKFYKEFNFLRHTKQDG